MGERSESSLSLAEKIDEYVVKLGYSSAHTLGVVVQLLTVGKIRLDFREYSERLQLENPAEVLSPTGGDAPDRVLPRRNAAGG